MAKKQIAFQREESKRIGLLMDEATIKGQVEEWESEDHTKLLMLCQKYGIAVGPSMFYQLAQALARELYPEQKKRGRKLKWTALNKGALVVEVDRLVKRDDPSHELEWACKQLANREPWKSFLDIKEEKKVSPDPGEPLRQIYYDFKDDKWAAVMSEAFKWHEHEGVIAEWEKRVIDFVSNPELE